VLGGDGRIYHRRQVVPNGGWGDWTGLGGDTVRDFAVAQNADGRLEIVAVFGDGALHDPWQTVPSGSWSGWASLANPSLPPATDLTVLAGGDGRLYAFLMRSDGALSYRAQAATNDGWAAPVHLLGHDLRWPCAAGVNPDGRLEIFVIGDDKHLYNRWQVDVARPDLWSQWVNLGGRDLHAGIGGARSR
jgi:hypothetical protein